MPCGSASSSMVSTAASAAPAFRVFSSGLRHTFLATGDLLQACLRHSLYQALAGYPDQTVSNAGRHDSLGRHFAQKALELPRTFRRIYLILLQQSLLQLPEGLGLIEQAPDRGCDAIEAEAGASIGLKRDKLVAKLSFHEVHRSRVNRQPRVSLRRLVSPAGFEPATY